MDGKQVCPASSFAFVLWSTKLLKLNFGYDEKN